MVTPLYDLATARIARFIADNPLEKIREELHIENDFTPEEEEEMRFNAEQVNNIIYHK